MKYKKEPLSIVEQVALLTDRGLSCQPERLATFLRQVNYYRLTGYLYAYRKSDIDDNFIDGTTFSMVEDRYYFDRELRLLIFDALERIEISVFRSHLVEFFSSKYGAFGFLERNSFRQDEIENFHEDFLKFSEVTKERSSSDFVKAYRSKYTSESHLPCWMLFEEMTFGALSKFYANLHQVDREVLSRHYGLTRKVFGSWLHMLAVVRNICAHHGRLWNRHFPIGFQIPKEKNLSDFHKPVKITTASNRVFPSLVVIQYLLNVIDVDNTWGSQLKALVSHYPELPMEQIGFPENWMEVPFWR